MVSTYSLKIDTFCHIIPPKFKDASQDTEEGLPALWDMDHRRRTIDRYPGVRQIIDLGIRGERQIMAAKEKGADVAKAANDEMAELVYKYPDYFVAAVACLPMNDIDTALQEIDRTVKDLKFRGIQLFSPINDRLMDSPEFEPIYQKMCEYDLPILVHPMIPARFASGLGIPLETSDMMFRLTNSGIMQKYPNLKVLTHHAGGGVPYYAKRIELTSTALMEMVYRTPYNDNLSRPPIEYLKKFYFDTATVGTAGLMCCYDFCGAERMLFGTDYPHDAQLGDTSIRGTIESIEQMDISDAEKKMIFEDNARTLFKLPI